MAEDRVMTINLRVVGYSASRTDNTAYIIRNVLKALGDLTGIEITEISYPRQEVVQQPESDSDPQDHEKKDPTHKGRE